ncbi:hypothetical protein MP228_010044 [Amoeboaphelidium protococcarum]|nr:hypothetical protein MP228_010044 [Amoeboaphelidium protococcarum]
MPSDQSVSQADVPRFNESFWGEDYNKGYDTLLERMKLAKHVCQELQFMISQRIDLEEEYSKKLGKIAKSQVMTDLIKQDHQDTNPYGISSLSNALESFKNEMEVHARNRTSLADELKAKCLKPLEAFTDQQRDVRKEQQAVVEKALKAKNSQHSILSKCEEKYRQRSAELEALQKQRNTATAKEADKLDQKISKAQLAARQAEQEYAQACDKMRDIHTTWIKDFFGACEEFQQLEEQRVDFLRGCLWTYSNAYSQVSVNDDASCENMRKVLEKCNISYDIALYVKSKRTGDTIPPAPEFRAYGQNTTPAKMGTPASSLQPSSGVGKSQQQSRVASGNFGQSQVNGAQSHVNAVDTLGMSKQNSFNPFKEDVQNFSDLSLNQQFTPASSTASPMNKVAVNASSIAQTHAFNPFMEEESPSIPTAAASSSVVIDSVKQQPASVASPASGMSYNPFDSDFVPQPTAPSLTPSVNGNGVDKKGAQNVLDRSKVSGQPWKAKVLYNYDAVNSDELNLDAGQYVTVMGQPEPSWLYGELSIGSKKSFGMFPSNVVERSLD